MKNSLLVLAGAFACWGSGCAPDDSSDTGRSALRPGTYYQPTQAYRVTIRSRNGIVTLLDVPRGVHLSLHGEQNSFDEGARGAFPHTFQGPLTLRARRTDEIEENEGSIAREVMAKAPLEMTLGNAVVVIDTLVVEESP